MAAKTYYLLGTATDTNYPATGANSWWGRLQDGGTAPTAGNSAYGYAPGKLATNSFARSRLGATGTSATTATTSFIDSTSGPQAGTGAAGTTSGDSFCTPAPLSGTFANTAWTFTLNMRAGVAGLVGLMRCRVWKSANANGSSATALTTSTLVTSAAATLSTTADSNLGFTWSPGAITLNNEYLFFQLEWRESSTTAGGSNTDTALFRIGTASITTPNFAGNYTDTISFAVTMAMAAAGTLAALSLPWSINYTTGANLPGQIDFSRTTSAARFNSSGIREVVASGIPRIDYDPNGSTYKGLLCEAAQATNKIVQSESCGIAPWNTTNSVFSTSSATGKNGSAMTLITANAGGPQEAGLYQGSIIMANTDFWYAFDLKAGTCNYVAATINTGSQATGVRQVFDLTDGSLGQVTTFTGPAGLATLIDAFSIPLGGGIYRCVLMVNLGNLSTGDIYFGLTMLPLKTGNQAGTEGRLVATYAGTETISCQCGCVVQSSVYCMHIPTTTAAVTRGGEIFSTVDAGLLSAKGWVIETGEAYSAGSVRGGAMTLLGINTVVGLGLDATDHLTTADGGTQTSGNTVDWGGQHRGGLAWDSTPRVSISLDGGTVVTAANTPVTPTILYFGNTNNGASGLFTGHIRLMGAFATLADATLPAYSTVGAAFGASYTNSAALAFSPAIGSDTGTNKISTPSASLATSTSISTAGTNRISAPTATLAVSPVSSPLGSLLMNGASSLAIATAISTVGSGIPYINSAALAVSPAIAAAANAVMPGSASLAVATAIAAASAALMSASGSLAVATAINSTTGTTRISTPTATLSIATATAAAGSLQAFPSATLNVSPAIAASGGLSFISTATLTFSPAIAAAGLLNVSALATVTFSPAIAAAGTELISASATLAVASAILPAGSLLLSGSASLSVASGINPTTGTTKITTASAALAVTMAIAAAGGLNFVSTATISFSPAIASAGPLNLTGSATVTFSPVETALGSISSTKTATLAFTSAIAPAGNLLLNASGSLGLTSGLSALAGFTFLGSASLALSPGSAASGNLLEQATAALALTAALSSSVPNFSASSAAGLALASAISPAGAINGNAQSSLGVGSGIGPSGTFSANLNSALALISGIASAGNYSANLSAALAAALGTSSAAGISSIQTAALSVSAGLAAASLLSATPSASLATTIGVASLAALVASAAAALTVSPAEQATSGGALYQVSATLAVSPGIAGSAKLNAAALAAIATATGLSATATEVIIAAASLAVIEAIAPSATEVITAAAILSGSFAEQALVTARDFTDTIALAATAALTAAGRLDAAGAATIPAVVSELVQSAAFMQAAGSIATAIGGATAGALSLLQNMTVTTTAGIAFDGRTTVTGSIGFAASAGSVANLNLGAAARLSFAATYAIEPGNVLEASDAVTIATRLIIGALLTAENPLAEILSVKGIWQGRFDLAGVYSDTTPLAGVVELTVRLGGVINDRPLLEGVVETIERLSGRV